MIFTLVLGILLLISAVNDIANSQYYMLSFDILMACVCFTYSFISFKYGRKPNARTGSTETKRSNRQG